MSSIKLQNVSRFVIMLRTLVKAMLRVFDDRVDWRNGGGERYVLACHWPSGAALSGELDEDESVL